MLEDKQVLVERKRNERFFNLDRSLLIKAIDNSKGYYGCDDCIYDRMEKDCQANNCQFLIFKKSKLNFLLGKK